VRGGLVIPLMLQDVTQHPAMVAFGMFSAPNDYFIAISKLIKDEISIQASVVKLIGTTVGQQ